MTWDQLKNEVDEWLAKNNIPGSVRIESISIHSLAEMLDKKLEPTEPHIVVWSKMATRKQRQS